MTPVAFTQRRTRRRSRPKTPEAAILSQIMDGFAAYGIRAQRLNSGAFKIGKPEAKRFFQATFKGCPDLIAFPFDDGRTLWVEVKAGRGKLSEDQAAFRDFCRGLSVPWVEARSWYDVERYINQARRGVA